MTRYLLGAVVRLWHRATKGGIDRWERRRVRSMAKASAPLHGEKIPAADMPLIEAWREDVEDKASRTAELPIVHVVHRRHTHRRPVRWQRVAARRRTLRGFHADPLAAPVPAQHRVEEPVLFGAWLEDWFRRPAALGPASTPFPEPPAEPEPWDLESFTQGWTRDDIARMVADAKAGAA